MAYNTKLASYLSGASKAQLDGWARGGVLRPEISSNPRLYSFRDIVALRTIAKLRSMVSLQRIRTALGTMKDQEFTDPLSVYRFATDGKTVKLWTDEGWLDLVANPGQFHLYGLGNIYDSFPNWRGETVPPLLAPHEGIEISPERLGGTPVISGTRIPFDLVVDLCTGSDALDPDEMKEMYPFIQASDVQQAIEFNNVVEKWTA